MAASRRRKAGPEPEDNQMEHLDENSQPEEIFLSILDNTEEIPEPAEPVEEEPLASPTPPKTRVKLDLTKKVRKPRNVPRFSQFRG